MQIRPGTAKLKKKKKEKKSLEKVHPSGDGTPSDWTTCRMAIRLGCPPGASLVYLSTGRLRKLFKRCIWHPDPICYLPRGSKLAQVHAVTRPRRLQTYLLEAHLTIRGLSIQTLVSMWAAGGHGNAFPASRQPSRDPHKTVLTSFQF